MCIRDSIIIDLDKIDHTTGLYISEGDQFLVMGHTGNIRGAKIPNALTCRNRYRRPISSSVLIAAELDYKDMVRVNVVCLAPLSQKGDLRQRGDLLHGRTQEIRLRPNHALSLIHI